MKFYDIKGYEGLYQISKCGQVNSLRKQTSPEEIILKQKILKTGYCGVGLWKDNKRKWFLVHRLVAQAFLGRVVGKLFINHKNGNKKDNNLRNLEWVTRSENMQHAFKNNLIAPRKPR